MNLSIQLQFKSKCGCPWSVYKIYFYFICYRTLQQYGAQSLSLEESLQNVVTIVEEGDLTPLIIVSSVLLVLLLGTILGTFLLWWYKIRPYEYKQMEDDAGSVSSHQVLKNDNLNVESSPVNRFTVEKKDSVILSGSTVQGKCECAIIYLFNFFFILETNDDTYQSKFPKSLTDLLENDAKLVGSSAAAITETPVINGDLKVDTRKSQAVRFNEMVERIDIEVDAEAEAVRNDSDDDQRL